MRKKEKAKREPEFFRSATNIKTRNYKVYYMKPLEKLLTFLVAFAAGAAVGYLFYGGIGKDEFGQATTLTLVLNILIPSVVGVIAGVLFLPIRVNSIIAKRKMNLRHQFRDMLDALTTSLGAGKNIVDSFKSVQEDLKVQYDEDAYILEELEVILSGIANNIPIEDLLLDFGERSSIDDIKSFSNVFKINYRKGGNIKDVIRNTHSILSDKMEIYEDIETIASSSRLEQSIMIIMPIGLVAMIKMMSPEFAANFVSPSGLVATTISIAIYVAAYYIGKKVLDIKV